MFSASKDNNDFKRSDSNRKEESKPQSNWGNNVELWEAFRSENESAFVEVYHTYFQLLFNYAKQLNPDSDSCKDFIQDFFIKLRRNRARLPEVSSIKAFLIKGLRNLMIDDYNKRSKMPLVEYNDQTHDFHVIPSFETLLIDRQITEDQLNKITQIIATLPSRQREAMHFFFYNQLSYEEISEIMNFGSVKAARNLIYRALKEIKERFDNI
ncbi:MAG: RNA polymerase subunit sigma [Rickettsiales bacterium]|nr:RNA polymerase subunit sigma [Rickettsiales bacterium]